VRKATPTAAQVRAFWKYMQKAYKTQVITKADSDEMKLAGWFLEKMGIQSKKTFLKRFTTTIGHKIYTPVKIGQGKAADRRNQFALCVHEHRHVLQFDKDPLSFLFNYATSSTKRSIYEVEAYRTNMELHYYFTGELLDINILGDTLRSYGCSKKDVRIFKKYLRMSAETIKRGGVSDSLTKKAIKWLEGQRTLRRVVRAR